MKPPRICIVPKTKGVGGMVTFLAKLSAGLKKRSIQVCFDLEDVPYDTVLVIGGTRQLPALFQAKKRRVPIVQRLDGMNWLHRKCKTGLRHYLRAEYGNWLLAFIRAYLADRVIYQSEFSRNWWEMVRAKTRVPNSVIYNGVDLDFYHIGQPPAIVDRRFRLLMVEGSLGGGYDMGLEHAVGLSEQLRVNHHIKVELIIVGRASQKLQDQWNQQVNYPIRWIGEVPQDKIPEYDRSAHLFFSADLNPSCPNAVIEAMACGLPVVAFNTGALPELVQEGAGRVVPYGGDPWRLEPPDLNALSQAAAEILSDLNTFRTAARTRAEMSFGLDKMVEEYLDILVK